MGRWKGFGGVGRLLRHTACTKKTRPIPVPLGGNMQLVKGLGKVEGKKKRKNAIGGEAP